MYDDYIMSAPYLRTQISLPLDLRRLIDLHRREKDESLSEYLRKSAILRLESEKKRRANLKKLSQQVVGALDLSKYAEWSTRKKIINWQRSIRHEKGI